MSMAKEVGVNGTGRGHLVPLPVGEQPLGAEPFPAGLLLLPDTEGCRRLAAALRCGSRPLDFPPEASYYADAMAGCVASDVASALPDEGFIADYNRLVLVGGSAALAAARSGSPAEYAPLVEFAAYLGGIGELQVPDPMPPGALGALIASALSAELATNGERGEALALLIDAIGRASSSSPLLAAGLCGDAASLHLAGEGGWQAGLTQLDAGIALIEGGGEVPLLAELHLAAGVLVHEHLEERPELLQAAVTHYLAACRESPFGTDRRVFGLAHMHLALLYLAMPMATASDQLRYGVAVSSLKKAVEALDPALYREESLQARFNLANALVYAPSSVQGDNIVEATEIYEEVALARRESGDAVGYARACANQGNALAHLGIFDHARSRMEEAMAIFSARGMTVERDAMLEALAEIGAGTVAQAAEHG